MTPHVGAQLVAAWQRLPASVRSRPAPQEAIDRFERDVGPIPSDFRWFLLELGGGPVGAEWVDDIEQLSATHAKFRSEPWTMTNCFVFGWDGAGNPMAIDHTTGRVVTEDHNFGGVHELAASFEAFLVRGLLKAG